MTVLTAIALMFVVNVNAQQKATGETREALLKYEKVLDKEGLRVLRNLCRRGEREFRDLPFASKTGIINAEHDGRPCPQGLEERGCIS